MEETARRISRLVRETRIIIYGQIAVITGNLGGIWKRCQDRSLMDAGNSIFY